MYSFHHSEVLKSVVLLRTRELSVLLLPIGDIRVIFLADRVVLAVGAHDTRIAIAYQILLVGRSVVGFDCIFGVALCKMQQYISSYTPRALCVEYYFYNGSSDFS